MTLKFPKSEDASTEGTLENKHSDHVCLGVMDVYGESDSLQRTLKAGEPRCVSGDLTCTQPRHMLRTPEHSGYRGNIPSKIKWRGAGERRVVAVERTENENTALHGCEHNKMRLDYPGASRRSVTPVQDWESGRNHNNETPSASQSSPCVPGVSSLSSVQTGDIQWWWAAVTPWLLPSCHLSAVASWLAARCPLHPALAGNSSGYIGCPGAVSKKDLRDLGRWLRW